MNQPLSAIANFANGSARRLRHGGVDAAVLLPVVERIAAEAHRAAEMVRRLRQQIDPVSPCAASIDLGRLARQVVRGLSTEAARAGVALRLDPMVPLPRVRCHPEAMAQALSYVLRQRIAALGAMRVDAAAIQVFVGPSVEGVGVTVRDSIGIGADEDPRPPAAGVVPDAALATEGLASAAVIVRAHGGHFAARRDGHGRLGLYFSVPLAGGGAAWAGRSTPPAP
ncbi:MAG: hypothetical protein U0802_13565 [Candidatus Binatia bacterium]